MARTITLLHFNDCYEINAREMEPVGGAARMVAKIRSFGPDALVLFSGDAFNPSLLSTVTQGKQMVEVLNCCGVRASCVGNHDFDYGVDNFEQRAAECHFPWLMANVLEAATGLPLGGAQPTALLEWQGVKVGLVGLVEQEWLTTLASVDPDEVQYSDFVAEGHRLAAELRAQGAKLVVALTHMRLPNDMRLAQSVPGIDLVLGGHDHEYYLLQSQPYGTAVVKSGTDFRDLTEIRITLEQAEPAAAAVEAVAAGAPASVGAGGLDDNHSSSGGADSAGADGCLGPAAVYEAAAAASLATSLVCSRPMGAAEQAGGQAGIGGRRLRVECVRHAITSDLPQDPEAAAIVERYNRVMGERMDVVVGHTATDLDGRFATVRTGESNLGNFVCDVWREACHADVALCNGGTLRSDRVHPAGPLTHRDLVSVLPMLDDTVKIQVTGTQLLGALENGVSEWPKHEGRFPQVSGIRFAFDPTQPPGQRVLADSVTVGNEPLQPGGTYSLATKAYLAEGRDGYDALQGSPMLCDCDCVPLLPTVVTNHFLLLRTVNRYVENTGRIPAWRRAAERMLRHSKSHTALSQQRLQEEGVSRTARKNPISGKWEIAPVVDGRIRRVDGSGGAGSGGDVAAA